MVGERGNTREFRRSLRTESGTKDFDGFEFPTGSCERLFAARAEPAVKIEAGGVVAGADGEDAAGTGDYRASGFEIIGDDNAPRGTNFPKLTVARLNSFEFCAQ